MGMDWSAISEASAVKDTQIVERLFEAGYFQADQKWAQVKDFLLTSPTVKAAVEEYRQFHELEGTGVDDALVTQMMRPRCGLPDLVRMEAGGLARWGFLDVTCCQNLGGLNPLSAEVERQCYIEALANWNEVCGLELKLIETMSAANIQSGIGTTGAGVLAYSYLPGINSGKSVKLTQVYNRATNWARNLLVQVITHEIGHALGLDHGPAGALMQPTADGRIVKPQAWDINQVRQRYGDPKAGKDPSPVPGDPAPVPVPPTGPTIDGSELVVVGTLAAGRYSLVAKKPTWEA